MSNTLTAVCSNNKDSIRSVNPKTSNATDLTQNNARHRSQNSRTSETCTNHKTGNGNQLKNQMSSVPLEFQTFSMLTFLSACKRRRLTEDGWGEGAECLVDSPDVLHGYLGAVSGLVHGCLGLVVFDPSQLGTVPR